MRHNEYDFYLSINNKIIDPNYTQRYHNLDDSGDRYFSANLRPNYQLRPILPVQLTQSPASTNRPFPETTSSRGATTG